MTEWQDIRALHHIRQHLNLLLQIVLLSVYPAYQTECSSPCSEEKKNVYCGVIDSGKCVKRHQEGDLLDCTEFHLPYAPLSPLSNVCLSCGDRIKSLMTESQCDFGEKIFLHVASFSDLPKKTLTI